MFGKIQLEWKKCDKYMCIKSAIQSIWGHTEDIES